MKVLNRAAVVFVASMMAQPVLACAGPGPTISFEPGQVQVSWSGQEQLQNLAEWATGNLDDIAAIWVVTPSYKLIDQSDHAQLARGQAAEVSNILLAYGIPEYLLKVVPVKDGDGSADEDDHMSVPSIAVRVEMLAERQPATEVAPGVYLAC